MGAPQYDGNPQDFVDAMAPYAIAAQNATGINANVILAQWGNETTWGTSKAWIDNANPTGIGITSSAVSGQDYGTVQGGVDAYINFVNDNSRYQAVKAAGVNNPQAQAVAFGNSGWAAGGYNNGGGPGSSLVADMGSFSAPTGVTPANLGATGLAANTPEQNAQLSAAVAEGGGPYLQALQAQQQASAAGTAITGTGTPGDTTANGDALSQITATLNQYGLGGLSGWAWNEITAGKNSDQVLIDLQNTQQFKDAFPGMAIRAQNGLPAITPAQYLSYEDTAFQMAQAAGLTPGTLDKNTVANLIGNDVSASELSQRVTQGYAAAMAAPPEVRTLLSQYFGVNTGDLAAYYLNPKNTQDLLQSQQVAAEVGTQAQQSGFGQLSASAATNLASELAAQGKVAPASATSAGNWNVDVSTQFGSLAPLAQLENAMPGMGAGAPAVSQQNLLDYGFLSKGQQQVQAAIETRKAFAGGGGGEDVSAKGVVGTGSASDAGTTQTQQSYG